MGFRPLVLAAVLLSATLAPGLERSTGADATARPVVTLIGVNDFHGILDARTARWATTIERLRAEAGGTDRSLLVGVGDNFGSSPPLSTLQDHDPTIRVLEAIEMDASAVGNHEFDRGWSWLQNKWQLTTGASRPSFPLLGSNVYDEGASDPAMPASFQRLVSGVRVCVVGATTRTTRGAVPNPGLLGTLSFRDPTTEVNREIERLQSLGTDCDLTVASIHEGAPDASASLEQNLAASSLFGDMVRGLHPDVDVLLNGHTHQSYVYTTRSSMDGHAVPILQAGEWTNSVSKVALAVDPSSNQAEVLDAAIVPRAAAADFSFARVAAVERVYRDSRFPVTAVTSIARWTWGGSSQMTFAVGSYDELPIGGTLTVLHGTRRLITAAISAPSGTVRLRKGVLRPGVYPLLVRYSGDDFHAPGEQQVSVAVRRATPSVKVQPVRPTLGAGSAIKVMIAAEGVTSVRGKVRVLVKGRSARCHLVDRRCVVTFASVRPGHKLRVQVRYSGSPLIRGTNVRTST